MKLRQISATTSKCKPWLTDHTVEFNTENIANKILAQALTMEVCKNKSTGNAAKTRKNAL